MTRVQVTRGRLPDNHALVWLKLDGQTTIATMAIQRPECPGSFICNDSWRSYVARLAFPQPLI